jgi:indole-3-glycerol phosphate synthase
MNTLEQINANRKKQVSEQKKLYPVPLLEKSIYFPSKTISLEKYIRRYDKSGIIAEIKRKSPSQGVINKYMDVEKTSIGYMQAGASAISVLTDYTFFGGSNEDLSVARKFNYCPILRKDFIVDEYQIIEAKSIGADAILLIAASLTKAKIKTFTDLAKSLGLEIIAEVHSRNEIDKIPDVATIIGVNNRNLKSQQIDINTSFQLLNHLPKEKTKISESGIDKAEAIIELKKIGYSGFLIGSYFMRHPEPSTVCKAFIASLEQLNLKKIKCDEN